MQPFTLYLPFTKHRQLAFLRRNIATRVLLYALLWLNLGNEKFLYSGPVHTLDKGYDDIIASGSLLMIGVDAAERSLNDEKKLQVEITINNLKDMEFVVSDVE